MTRPVLKGEVSHVVTARGVEFWCSGQLLQVIPPEKLPDLLIDLAAEIARRMAR